MGYKHIKIDTEKRVASFFPKWIEHKDNYESYPHSNSWAELFVRQPRYINESSIKYAFLPPFLRGVKNNNYGGKITNNVKAILRTIPCGCQSCGFHTIIELDKLQSMLDESSAGRVTVEEFLEKLDECIDVTLLQMGGKTNKKVAIESAVSTITIWRSK